MIAAVNLGGDADSIGAVYGQIAGALYGYDAIPQRCLAAIKDREKINELIESLIFQAENRSERFFAEGGSLGLFAGTM